MTTIDVDIFRPGTEANNAKLDQCFAIRYKVFVEEQNVPSDLEMDGLDEETFQALLLADNQPVATARFHILTDESQVKVERVAVLKAWRRKGLADKIMDAIEDYARSEHNIQEVKLNAQITAVPFYKKRGYEIVSDSFLDADIVHYTMTRQL